MGAYEQKMQQRRQQARLEAKDRHPDSNQTKWTPFVDVKPAMKPLDLQRAGFPEEVWANSRYVVYVHYLSTILGKVTHLDIHRVDKRPLHDWSELMQVKREILGVNVDAVELYPAESREVDLGNTYSLWCLPPGQMFPFGWLARAKVGETIESPTGDLPKED